MSQVGAAYSPDPPHLVDVEDLPTEKVPISSLVAADSPRRSGESAAHVRRLAQSEEPLPAILAHRPTMRVIDGMHRLRAAELRGQEHIDVRYVDGDEACAFVLAVQANTAHGLPLTLADRKVAAERIMETYPHWSDRMIAQATGLAAKTVAARRKRLSGEKQHLDVRVGRDGRARPVNGAARREAAARLISDNPAASLREIAERTGISPETVRSVRAQIMDSTRPAGAQPVNGAETASRPRRDRPGRQRSRHKVPAGVSALEALRADPAFRSNERARSLLRMLSSCAVLDEACSELIENVPVHCLERVADAARACAQGWQNFTERVEVAGLQGLRASSREITPEAAE